MSNDATATPSADPTEIARIKTETLSDKSIAYAVELKVGETTVILAAISRIHAIALCDELNECAWAEVS